MKGENVGALGSITNFNRLARLDYYDRNAMHFRAGGGQVFAGGAAGVNLSQIIPDPAYASGYPWFLEFAYIRITRLSVATAINGINAWLADNNNSPFPTAAFDLIRFYKPNIGDSLDFNVSGLWFPGLPASVANPNINLIFGGNSDTGGSVVVDWGWKITAYQP
jgi:hypothetical protein